MARTRSGSYRRAHHYPPTFCCVQRAPDARWIARKHEMGSTWQNMTAAEFYEDVQTTAAGLIGLGLTMVTQSLPVTNTLRVDAPRLCCMDRLLPFQFRNILD